jgi:mRNA-degrading endonuclease RelE of RelBE toxin-antitoxin system
LTRSVSRQLRHEPFKETRHRKPLRPNLIAPWELRVGQLRVFYEVVGVESGIVRILAVGRKVRNTLRIGDAEIRL